VPGSSDPFAQPGWKGGWKAKMGDQPAEAVRAQKENPQGTQKQQVKKSITNHPAFIVEAKITDVTDFTIRGV
jgi:hypothetical protein